MRKVIMALFFWMSGFPAFAGAILPVVIPNTEQNFTVYLTGYSYWDNSPPGSSEISHPVVHSVAGGNGTYKDPITLAVGHIIDGGEDILDFPMGTLFYIINLRKYAIVEDTCGDGDRPQDGPCHVGKQGVPWLDIYVDGSGFEADVSEACFNDLTGFQRVIMTPRSNYVVEAGSLTESGCKVFLQ